MNSTKREPKWQMILIAAVSVMIIFGLFAGVGANVLEDIQTEESTTTTVTNESWPSASTSDETLDNGFCYNPSTIIVENQSTDALANETLDAANWSTAKWADNKISLVSASTYLGDNLNITYGYYGDSYCVMEDSNEGIGNLSSYMGLLGTVVVLGAIIVALTGVFLMFRFRRS